MASFWAFYTWKPFKQRLGFKRRDFRLSQVTDKTQAVIGRIVLARLAQNYMSHSVIGYTNGKECGSG